MNNTRIHTEQNTEKHGINFQFPLFPELGLSVNIMIDLITRTNFLLDQQRKSLEEKFLKEGGYTENLFKKRLDFRNK